MKTLFVTISIICSFTFNSCKIAEKKGEPIQGKNFTNGIYSGKFKGGLNSAQVEVSIINNKIAQINLIKHDAWKGKKAEDSVINRIIRQQSTNVDAVTGATNSSHVIMNAVQDAISKAK